MKTLIAAIALAFPVFAQAQTAPAPAPGEAPKMKCCCKDMAKPMACCEEHGRGESDKGGHEGHETTGQE